MQIAQCILKNRYLITKFTPRKLYNNNINNNFVSAKSQRSSNRLIMAFSFLHETPISYFTRRLMCIKLRSSETSYFSFDSTTAVSAGDFLHFDTDELQVNKRELVEFQKGHLFQGDMVATEQMCGLVCKRHDWCKTFNHHALGKVCQLIMTDFRLLNTTQGK